VDGFRLKGHSQKYEMALEVLKKSTDTGIIFNKKIPSNTI
jgi:hypothetical protein